MVVDLSELGFMRLFSYKFYELMERNYKKKYMN